MVFVFTKNKIIKALFLIHIFFGSYSICKANSTCDSYLNSNETIEYYDQHESIVLKLDGLLMSNEGSYANPINQKQRQFLVDLGVSFKGNYVTLPSIESMARRYNQMVDALVSQGVVDASDVIYWGDTFVLNEKLSAVKYGDPKPNGAKTFIPKNYILYEGRYILVEKARAMNLSNVELATFLFSAEVFDSFMALGLTPVAQSFDEIFHYETFYDKSWGQEQAVLHDIAHLGGFIDTPEMMRLFKKWSLFVRGQSNHYLGSTFVSLNENLVLLNSNLSKGVSKDLFEPLGLPIWFRQKSNNEFITSVAESIDDYIKALSDDEIIKLAERIIIIYPEYRLPIGGSARTAAFAVRRNPTQPLDFNFITLSRGFEEYRKYVPSLNDGWYKKIRSYTRTQNSAEASLQSVRYTITQFLLEYDKISGLGFEDYLAKFQPELFNIYLDE